MYRCRGSAALRWCSRRSRGCRVSGSVDDCQLTHGDGVGASIAVRIAERQLGPLHNIGLGGDRQLTADDIATLRVSRILFNDPPAPKDPRSHDFAEAFIRGGGSRSAMEIVDSRG